MIGLDTNVLVRYLTQDEPQQAAIVNQLIEDQLTVSNPGFIPAIVLVEVVWVLEACYQQTRAGIQAVVTALLTTKQLVVEQADLVYLALKRFSNSAADFSDALIAVICEHRGCTSIVSFDKKAHSIGMLHPTQSKL